jgi:hypothetical protein
VRGGAAPDTAERYKAAFATEAGVRYWQQVSKDVLGRYGKQPGDRDYHDKTQYTEPTGLKQALKWMVGEEPLPPTSNFRRPLKRPTGTERHEVRWQTGKLPALGSPADESPTGREAQEQT